MTSLSILAQALSTRCHTDYTRLIAERNEITLEVPREKLLSLCQLLRDDPAFKFEMLIDVVGVDYLHYGLDDWQTQSATETGFGRGVMPDAFCVEKAPKERFAVVYHLLSITHNWRLRLRVMLQGETDLMLDSVTPLWASANWSEREVFDLFGIFFKNHEDLRRILTDYGFVGHPFRKDFPLVGNVEVRYDAALKAVIYEPVNIIPRVLEPKVIREDNRYDHPAQPGGAAHGN